MKTFNDIIDVIRPIVIKKTRERNLPRECKVNINKYIKILKNRAYNDKFIKDANSSVISEITIQLYDKNIINKWDKETAKWSYWVTINIGWLALEYFKSYGRKRIKEQKEKKQFGTSVHSINYDFNMTGCPMESMTGPADEMMYEKEFLKVISDYYGEGIFEMRLDGMTPRAIAKKLGKPAQTISTYLYRKKLGLLTHLKKNGYSLDDLPESIVGRLT